LLNISKMDKIDREGMYKVYDMWPQIAKESYSLVDDPIDYKNIDHIVFAGMGGSGAVGDLLSSILSKSSIHVSLVKGYHLPNTVDKNTLVVTTSVSGNTDEALHVLAAAAKKDCRLVAFSSGGKMAAYCKRRDIEYRNIVMTHSPRTSFIKYTYHILGTLNSVVPVKKSDILDSISDIEKMSFKISSGNLSSSNPSLELARWIDGIPVIYYPWGLQASAIRFKNSLQENAKMHAIAEDIIETCHNGIVSWERKSGAQPILIEGKEDYIRTKDKWRIIKEYFEQNGIEYWEVRSISGSILSKLVCLIYLLDYASIYCAILNGIDPSPVRSIDFIKKRL
jgi:glucose/mannose-6-phosphate isomerase